MSNLWWAAIVCAAASDEPSSAGSLAPDSVASALSRVDWLSWAASPGEIERFLDGSLAEGGLFWETLSEPARADTSDLRAAPLYAVEAELLEVKNGPQEHTLLDIREAIVYTNRTSEPLEGLALRVFGNGQDIRPGRARILGIWADNQPAQFSLDGTILSIELQRPLPPGETARLLVHLVQHVPEFDPGGSASREVEPESTGVLGRASGSVNLGHWLPLVTPVDERGRFDTRPIRTNTEHAMFEPALFQVVLDIPSRFKVASTGSVMQRIDGDGHSTVIAAAASARSFAIELLSSASTYEEQVAGTTIRVTCPSLSPEAAHHLMSYAKSAVELFSQHFGPTSQRELDLVEAPLDQLLAIEHPGLIVVDLLHDDFPVRLGPIRSGSPSGNPDLEWAVVHEIAHQWWGIDVGNDPALEPWLDEALASSAAGVYWRERYGEKALGERYQRAIREPVQRLMRRGVEDLPADLPAWKYDVEQYAAFVFGRGGLFFEELRAALGDELFFLALRRYRERYQGLFATADALIDCFAEVAKEAGLEPDLVRELHRRWIHEAHSYEDLLPSP